MKDPTDNKCTCTDGNYGHPDCPVHSPNTKKILYGTKDGIYDQDAKKVPDTEKCTCHNICMVNDCPHYPCPVHKKYHHEKSPPKKADWEGRLLELLRELDQEESSAYKFNFEGEDWVNPKLITFIKRVELAMNRKGNKQAEEGNKKAYAEGFNQGQDLMKHVLTMKYEEKINMAYAQGLTDGTLKTLDKISPRSKI